MNRWVYIPEEKAKIRKNYVSDALLIQDEYRASRYQPNIIQYNSHTLPPLFPCILFQAGRVTPEGPQVHGVPVSSLRIREGSIFPRATYGNSQEEIPSKHKLNYSQHYSGEKKGPKTEITRKRNEDLKNSMLNRPPIRTTTIGGPNNIKKVQ